MKTSEVFRAAKKRLWDGVSNYADTPGTRYLCHAISLSNGRSEGDKRRVEDIVQKLLYPHYTLESWLNECGFDSYGDRKKTQQTRHAWVDHLIKHYESIGD